MLPNNNNKEPIIAEGMTAREWVDLLKTDKAVDAMKALNYFDGQQEQEIIKVLNDPSRGRRNWKKKGLTPRFRNITKMVVESSGMLFKDADPQFEIFPKNSNETDITQNSYLLEQLARTEFGEFMHNLDQVTRLLKTTLVLVQWDQEDEQLAFDVLHRGNCEVVINPATRKPLAFIHRTGSDGETTRYTVWTKDQTFDLSETRNQITASSPMPNPFGILPIIPWYDTQTPRAGFWVEQDKSLVNLNEMVNLHMTDSEYSILWSKMSTLFTNMRPADGSTATMEVQETIGSPIPRLREVADAAASAGPGEAVVLSGNGVDAPFIEYKNPNIDLKPLDEVVMSWIQGVAGDWSVKVETSADGRARANSGFQLVVEEMRNIDLRKQRQRMFEQAFKRFYKVVSRVLNTVEGGTVLDEQAELFAKFPEIKLPVDENQDEQVWQQRIEKGRATEIDYFMTKFGMSEEEAEEKWLSIIEFNKRKAELTGPQSRLTGEVGPDLTTPYESKSEGSLASPLTPAGNQPDPMN